VVGDRSQDSAASTAAKIALSSGGYAALLLLAALFPTGELGLWRFVAWQ